PPEPPQPPAPPAPPAPLAPPVPPTPLAPPVPPSPLCPMAPHIDNHPVLTLFLPSAFDEYLSEPDYDKGPDVDVPAPAPAPRWGQPEDFTWDESAVLPDCPPLVSHAARALPAPYTRAACDLRARCSNTACAAQVLPALPTRCLHCLRVLPALPVRCTLCPCAVRLVSVLPAPYARAACELPALPACYLHRLRALPLLPVHCTLCFLPSSAALPEPRYLA
ncbi:unnamed protein product, partial [Closterium sp. NIES-54]